MLGRMAIRGIASAGVLGLAFWAQAQEQATAVFCEHGSYRGYCFTLGGSEPNFGRGGLMNDQVSSAQLTGRWEICTDGNYRGSCVEVTGNIPNMSAVGMNDSLSSARYLGPLAPPPPLPSPPVPPPPATTANAPPPPAAASDVPLSVQRAMLQRKIDSAVSAQDFVDALDLVDQFRELGGIIPLALLLIESNAAIEAGDPERARAALVDYFNRATDSDPGFQNALNMFEGVQDAKPQSRSKLAPTPAPAPAAPPRVSSGTGTMLAPSGGDCSALEAQTIAHIRQLGTSSTGNQCMAQRDAAAVYDEAVRFFQMCPSYDPSGDARRQMEALSQQARAILADCGTVRPY